MGAKNTQFNTRGPFLGEYVSGKYVGYHSEQLTDATPAETASATGGSKTTPGDGYHYHHFYATVPGAPYTKTPNTSETLVVVGDLTCDILIVGGCLLYTSPSPRD